jgi:hypothetical protein
LDDERPKIEDAPEKMLGSVRSILTDIAESAHEDDAQCLASELQAGLDQSTVSYTGSDFDFHTCSDMSPQQMNEVRAAMR